MWLSFTLPYIISISYYTAEYCRFRNADAAYDGVMYRLTKLAITQDGGYATFIVTLGDIDWFTPNDECKARSLTGGLRWHIIIINRRTLFLALSPPTIRPI